jgi:GDP-L-fucose synthase
MLTHDASIFVAGHRGMVGSACVRALRSRGFANVITRSRAELDLTDRRALDPFFAEARPEYVIDAAARVGGIVANSTYPVEFLVENLDIQNNLISAAHRAGVRKLLFLGSSCIYPKFAPQPIREDALLTGLLEPTNEPYALAKICGIRLCQAYQREYGANFISAMPTNLYGSNDNFDLTTSHVLPALLRKFHEAKAHGAPRVILWGTGSPRREFLHVDDLADACLFLLEHYDDPAIINIGYGEDVSISELAGLIRELVGYQGHIEWDTSKPDGTPRKLLDVSRIQALGWRAKISLGDGLRSTYRWFLDHMAELSRP